MAKVKKEEKEPVKKDNKELLKEICLEDNIDNISFNEEVFIIKFGDIKNIPVYSEDDIATNSNDIEYYLLETYIEIPYTFEPGKCRLHRGIINEYETGGEINFYSYSGFTHYSGQTFCWGACGVDSTCNEIRLEGLNSDRFTILLTQFYNYLSHSSHPSQGDNIYKRLDVELDEKVKYKLTETVTINDILYPRTVLKTTENLNIKSVDYEQPYIKVLKEFKDRSFVYNNETIIPKVVIHHTISNLDTITENIRVNHNELLEEIKNSQTEKLKYEINNKRPITFQDLLHKFPNKLSRVDGSTYI